MGAAAVADAHRSGEDRRLIGPGGKMIRSIQETTGAVIEVDDDGTVTIASTDAEGAKAAMAKVEAITASVQIGRIYEGRVTSVKDFGAFVEILPGKDGLCHISELSDEYVNSVERRVQGRRFHARQSDRDRRPRPRQAQPQAGAARNGDGGQRQIGHAVRAFVRWSSRFSV